MTVVCVGTSHWSAPVESMERALSMAQGIAASYESAVRDGCAGIYPWSELVLLATCNRVELYAAADGDGRTACDRLGFGLTAGGAGLDLVTYTHLGEAAVRHLARVAAGLDSMVLGEPEIVGQVARAFGRATCRNGGPPILDSVARVAVRAGRRARTETGISRGPASMSTLALRLAAERLGSLAGRNVLVLGAGKTGRLACVALRAAGDAHTRITVINRTLARADALAHRVGAHAAPLEELARLLPAADLVISSTSAPAHLIDAALVATIMRDRPERPLVLVDLAVPRDVDPACAQLTGVTRIGIEDLRQRRDANLEARRSHVAAVDAIIEDALRDWRQDEETEPVIADMYRSAEAARLHVLERTWPDLDRADGATRARIDHLTRTLVRRILGDAAARLRNEAETERRQALARAARTLFGVDTRSTESAPEASRPESA